ncbi:hypothetical protein NUW58_g6433 [Xylaria curta]|uniref:Uncharacterized protein n=1 Tax=Xylaria curta TaxID=42375 RepID=A0ACC1NVF7_9PEZI|nr:hypothetical protein NUW58_g6433 [Xylaria curta]
MRLTRAGPALSGLSLLSAVSAQTPSQPARIADYNWYGCRTEATGGRALRAFTYADDTMTLESCMNFCKDKGTTFFGTEYGRECYCGNKLETGSKSAPASDCSMLCAGNAAEYCGAGDRLSVYLLNGTEVAPEPTVTAKPIPTAFPEGWTAQGCWQDGPNGRIMPTYNAPDNDALTPQSCAALCDERGYTISGTEYYRQCFCSNAIYNGGVKGTDETKCNTPCSGNPDVNCGGAGYLTIYSKGTPQTFQPPVVQTGGLNNSWTYQGCYNDNVNNQRTLPWQLRFPGTMTATTCLARCAQFGYAAAGLEYGDCNVVCAGNASAICGGGARLSMYYYTGSTPLYVFNYPQGNNAGTYSNLVGGVVTPLMTMQSITGKVTFLEKWGTGAPNSTGAYELDLSQTGNFSRAWRTMHLKTDVFCSAGVILPDKAGRQLTVGGWSLDSTYGVRLYTPDGSDGVKGVNDWEENVNTLKLQRGRWYPSAMVMTNGSILVVGGEIGSNDRAEPTLELLPNSGPYLYMDWLARTDPNNLYPFLAVLPGGGIFGKAVGRVFEKREDESAMLSGASSQWPIGRRGGDEDGWRREGRCEKATPLRAGGAIRGRERDEKQKNLGWRGRSKVNMAVLVVVSTLWDAANQPTPAAGPCAVGLWLDRQFPGCLIERPHLTVIDEETPQAILYAPSYPPQRHAVKIPTTLTARAASLAITPARSGPLYIRTFATTDATTPETATIPTQTPSEPSEPNPPRRLPYFVGRNNLNNFSIYEKSKRGGNLQLTYLKRGEGDLMALKQDIKDALQLSDKEITINDLTKHIMIRGRKREKVLNFLHIAGF